MSMPLLPMPTTYHPLAPHVHGIEGIDVVVRVQLDAVELAGEPRLGPTRVPMMAVADEERVVVANLTRRQRDTPDAIRRPLGMLHLGVEDDERPQLEVVAVVGHVSSDVGVVGIVREVRVAQADREVVELQALLGGVDVERAVGRGAAVLVLEHPIAADLIRHLETVERDALGERLAVVSPEPAPMMQALGYCDILIGTQTTHSECRVT